MDGSSSSKSESVGLSVRARFAAALVLLAALTGLSTPVLAQTTPDPFPWDVNHDGVVNVNDLVAISNRWLWVGPPGGIPEDVNRDGVVNINDLVEVSAHFGETRPTASATSTSSATASTTATVTTTPTITVTPTPTTSPTATSIGTPSASQTATPTHAPTAAVPTLTPTVPGVGSTATSLSVSPSSVNVLPNATLTVNLVLATDRVTRGTQFGLTFDPSILRVQSVDEGTFYSDWAAANGAGTTVFPAWAIHNSAGTVSAGTIIVTGGPPTGGPTGTGTVATVSLQAIANGSSPLTLTDVAISGLDSGGNPVTIQGTAVHNAVVTVGASATATPSPTVLATSTTTRTPFPTFSTPTITPTVTSTPLTRKGSLSFDPPSKAVALSTSTTYSVDVKIALDPGVLSRGIQFGVIYDATRINVTRVDVGSLYSDWATAHGGTAQVASPFTPNNTTGRTAVGSIVITTPEGPSHFDGPSGSGVAATIRFRAIAQGSAKLDFVTSAISPLISYVIPGNADPGQGSAATTSGEIVVGGAATSTPTQTPTPTPTPTITITPTGTPTLTPTATVSTTVITGTTLPAADFATNTPTPGAVSSSNTSLSISPSTKNVQVGDAFTVDVVVNVDRVSRGAQFSLTFDKSIVEVESVDEGTFYRNWATANGRDTTVLPQWTPDNARGKVSVGSVLIASSGLANGVTDLAGASGNGTVATLSLKALANGQTALTLGDVVVNGLDSAGTAKPIDGTVVNNGQITVGASLTPTVSTTATTTAAQATATQSALAAVANPNAQATLPPSAQANLGGGTTRSGQNSSAVTSATGSTAADNQASAGGGTASSGSASGGQAGAPGTTAQAGQPNRTTGAAQQSGVATSGGDTSAGSSETTATGTVTTSAAQATSVSRPTPAAGGVGARDSAGDTKARPTGGVIATIDLSAAIDERGVVQREVQFTDPGGSFSLFIASNTIALDKDHKPLRAIQVEVLDDHPVVPDDRALLGQALEFNPSGASFDPPIRVSLGYDVADIPDGFGGADLDLAYFDGPRGQWVTLSGTAEPATRTVAAATSHFTSFAVLTRTAPGVNWALIFGLVALEVGLGVAGFVFVSLRRRTAAVDEPGADELFAPSRVDEPVALHPFELPAPPDLEQTPITAGALGKVEEHATET
jgi:hypothetical protein